MNLRALPGHELVLAGIHDLAEGRRTAEALLVAIGAPRLRRAGIELPHFSIANPEHDLYAMLATADPDGAHSRYNALIRQLVSFERAVECAA